MFSQKNQQSQNELEGFLGGMSPLVSKDNNRSVSFGAGQSKPATSSMSIDSAASSGNTRAPLGEMQNTFEFKTMAAHKQQQQQEAAAFKASKPTFTFGAAAAVAPAAARQPQAARAPAPAAPPAAAAPAAAAKAAFGGARNLQAMMPSPEPATPASCSAESRGAPPLATLNNLATFGGVCSDSDTVTPIAPAHAPGHVPLSSSLSPADSGSPSAATTSGTGSRLVWGDILLWRQPLQTATIFTAGLLAFWAANYLVFGRHRFTLVSGLSYVLLLDLGANFFRYFVSKNWHDQCLWGGAAQLKQLLTTMNAYVLHLAAAHDRYLSAVDPFVTLKVAGGLWAATWVGSYLSLYWCWLLAYVGAFSLPYLLTTYKAQLTAAVDAAKAATIDRVDATGLPRTARALFLLGAVATLWLTSSCAQAAIGLFVALTYWRTLLAPREIDVIRTAAAPYTASALKVGRRISAAAGDAFDRMSTAGPKSRTKSHFGAKARLE